MSSKWKTLNDLNSQLDTALAAATTGASDRAMAQRIISAAETGGSEAAKEVASEMTPEQAARVIRHI